MNSSLWLKLLRVGWRVGSAVYYRSVRYGLYLLSYLRSPEQAVMTWPEGAPTALPLGARVVVFVHFDGKGEVRPYVRHYLASLQSAGLDVVFVSNAGRLLDESLDAIRPLCAGVLVRRNIGYDFAAMREGLSHFGLPRANTEMIILANDSVYGPLRPLDDMMAKVDFAKADLWGATESWQAYYHLQSYFLVAGPQAFRHPAWRVFWARVRPVASKSVIITRYEIGFTQWMIRSGLTCAALWPYSDLLKTVMPVAALDAEWNPRSTADALLNARDAHVNQLRACYANHVALNPTSDLWRQLLRAGYPFIKRELLRSNPTRVPDVIDWRDEVAAIGSADIAVIERDLQRLQKNRAP
jgi:lipopolysaccharide biosynthesis protein